MGAAQLLLDGPGEPGPERGNVKVGPLWYRYAAN